MLPPLPHETNEKKMTHGALWSKNESIVPVGSKSMLWTPTPLAKTSETAVFVKDASELRIKTGQAGLLTLNSNALWEISKQPAPSTLWVKPHSGYLWPQGPATIPVPGHLWPSASSLPELGLGPISARSRRSEIASMALESTELWKLSTVGSIEEDATSSGLWSDKCVSHEYSQQSASTGTCDLLWPTAPLLPASYITTIRSRTAVNSTLTTLESTELWKTPMVVPRPGLWSAPIKKSGLWPQGENSVVAVGGLWPSTSGFPVKAGVASVVRAQSALATPSVLSSISLWSPVAGDIKIGLWAAPEKKTGLWPSGEVEKSIPVGSLWPSAPVMLAPKVANAVRARSTPTSLARLESTELWKPAAVEVTAKPDFVESIVEEEGIIEATLWVKEQDAPIVTSGYLWPSARSLPVPCLSSTTLPTRSHFTVTTLPVLESAGLWSSEVVTKVSLWSPPVNRTGLWPHVQTKVVSTGSLWPSAPLLSAPAILAAHLTRSRSQAVVARLESTELWPAGVVTRASLWSLPAKKTGLWPHGKIRTLSIGSLWPCAPSLSTTIAAVAPSVRSKPIPFLASLESTGLWSTKAVTQASLWSTPTNKTGLWPHGRTKTVSVGNLWPSAPGLSPAVAIAALPIRKRLPGVLAKLETTELWRPATTTQPVVNTTEYEPVTTRIEEAPTHLWAPKESTPAITSGYLWPLAPVLLASLAATLPTRPRPLATPATLESNQLWSPTVHVVKPKLWSAPVVETGLWPHGRSQITTVGSLWPSAHSLSVEASTHNVRVVRFITTLEPIQSRQLWSVPKASVQQLWVAPEKRTGLWPSGEVEKISMGKLWPCASALLTTYSNEALPLPPRALAITLPVLKSRALWGSTPEVVKAALWSSEPVKSGLWPHGETSGTIARKEPWCVTEGVEISWRMNLLLEVVIDEKRVVRKRRAVNAVAEVSGALWRMSEETVERESDWLLRKAEEVRSLVSDAIQSGAEDFQPIVEDDQPVVNPGLWTKSLPVPNDLSTGALWQPRTADSTIEAPRAKFNGYDVLRKTVRPTDLRLSPVQGKLWDLPLPEVSRQHTWEPTPPQGLWNVDGTTATLSQINGQKSLLWNKHGKDRRALFAHLFSSSPIPRRIASLAALEVVHGSLWIPAQGLENVQTHGLWHFPAAANTGLTAPTTAGAGAPPRGRLSITPRTHLLWQKCDKPLQPVIPAFITIPATRLWVNKRAANTPPLFLANVEGPMWVADKQRGRPRALWHAQPSGTKKGLWNNYNTPTLAEISRTETKPKLWSKLGSATESIFEYLVVQSIRSTTRKSENNVIIPMEESLWKSPPVLTPAQQELWQKEEGKSELWTANGITMTLSEMTLVPVTTSHLWGKDKVDAAPIFADLSLESSRSRREFTLKAFSAPPEGLWRKQVVEQVVERPHNMLWGMTIENKPVDEDVSKKVLTLWQKDNTTAPMFADLPIESFRSKKDTSSITLPVFSEGMWKKKVALPKSPHLWKPTPKPTGLWDINAKTKTLAQISLERKATGTKRSLWSKGGASRTTAKVPQRSPLATVRIPEDLTLPKVSGGLWKPETAAQHPPQLWTVPKPVIKVAKPTETLLWVHGNGSKTTEAVPERTKVAFLASDAPLPKVSGTLWKPKSPPKPTGLWKRPIKTLAPTTLSPSAPLWAKATASRTTTAVPTRLTPSPKKKDTHTTLTVVSGCLWQPKSKAPVKGLWKHEDKPIISPQPRRASLLWERHSASRTTTATPIRTTVPKRLTNEPLPIVTGTLWQRKSPEAPKGLWRRPIKTVASLRKTSTSTLLWSKELASRTTTAHPERTQFVPKPVSRKIELTAATGELWKLETTVPQSTTLWSSKPTSPASGVWDAEGRTPSLAEIKRQLASRQDTLWQRRSVLTSKAASIDPTNKLYACIPIAKKPRVASTSTTLPPIGGDGTLWEHTEEPTEDTIMWITRSSRSSSVDGFVSPNLSRASTLSDMSEAEFSPSTTGEDDFSPTIARIHSTKASISSAAGESLWRPSSGETAAKKQGLWDGDEAAGKRGSVLVTARPVRVVLPGQDNKELPMFDASHSLWKPSSADAETKVCIHLT